MIRNIITILFTIFTVLANAEIYRDITVASDGSGDYKTVGEAIQAIPSTNFQRFVILVKDGVYNEKIRIEKDYLTLVGESREHTIIQYNQLKKDWDANKDFEGPAVVNIHADDVILENLTIQNTMPEIGPNAYVIYGMGTRTVIQNCNLLGNGANSVSLMNYKTGMYYLKGCRIEGTVDFMRAMGWCYIDDCTLFQKEAIASVWHAGIQNPDQKMVIKNSTFDGVEHYFIGRHHYDAQFFVIDCNFTEKLADKPLYQKTYKNPEKDRPYVYGDRHYYFNCKKEGGNYAWMEDNLSDFSKDIKPLDITANWTFDGQWNPENPSTPRLIQHQIVEDKIHLHFDQPITVQGKVVLETPSGKTLNFAKGKGRSILVFTSYEKLKASDFKGKLRIIDGDLLATSAACTTTKVEL